MTPAATPGVRTLADGLGLFAATACAVHCIALPALLVVGATIVISIKLLKGGTSRKDQAEDSKIIQEIYQGLSRMEERVEALETILLDREKRERRHEE